MKTKADLLLMVRGILAISVLVWHFVGYAGTIPPLINIPGRTAVWIFFGISGYVMGYGFFNKKYSFTKESLVSFYKARFFRIYPLFILISIISALFIYYKTNIFPINQNNLVRELFMLQFNHSYSLSGVFWTLGIEVQYYLIAPLLSYLIISFLDNKIILAVLVYGILVLIVPLSNYFFGFELDSRNLVGNLSHFFMGMMGCFYVQKYRYRILNLNGVLLVIILLFLSNYLYHTKQAYYFVFGSFFIDIIILALIFLHQNFNNSEFSDMLRIGRLFILSGTISYGIYAWHPLILESIPAGWKSFYFILILTWVISYISYSIFEEKLINWNKKKI